LTSASLNEKKELDIYNGKDEEGDKGKANELKN
jgi:hypothetical protein